MEQLDQAYGYILYRKQLDQPLHDAILKLDNMQDFATVYLDGKLVGTLDRHYHQTSLKLTSATPALLDILIENTGRLNSTRGMRGERKGITAASLDATPLTGWQIYTLPMQGAGAPSFESHPKGGVSSEARPLSTTTPQFSAGTFTLPQLGDAFLDVSTLGKGLIWINGHPLGRFWSIGPQQTLYVPAPWLKQGTNQVTIFAMLPGTSTTLVGRLKPILDGPPPPTPQTPSAPKPQPKTPSSAPT